VLLIMKHYIELIKYIENLVLIHKLKIEQNKTFLKNFHILIYQDFPKLYHQVHL